ncbi:MAG: lysylphosphatidylglycerol synthase transmembrane domain-containing protein [Melioribacteraceae bacterium]|nr:lysylphosphatidylglycerol synthase transmembrane domain-containing protein [Melioribacteraceae bacterium]
MKKRLVFIIRLIFTILLATFALYKAGLLNSEGRKEFVDLLSDVRWIYVLASFLIMFVLNFSSSVKWYMLLLSKKISISLWRIYAYYSIGRFFNLILPTSMGGDIVRIFQLGKYTGKKEIAAASVIVERFTGLIVLLMMTIAAVILNLQIFNQLWLASALILASIALGLIIWIVLDSRVFNFFSNKVQKIKILVKIFNKLNKIRETIIDFKSDRRAISWAIINSIIFQLLAVMNVWITSKAFGDELDILTCLVAVPVILFIMNIPFSIGGIGLMEFGYVFTLTLFAISPSLSLSTALLIRVKGIFDALLGGIFYILLNRSSSIIEEIKTERVKG